LNEDLAVPEGIVTRLGFLLYRSGFDEPWAAHRLGIPIEGVLMAVGLAVAAKRVVRTRHRAGLLGPEAMAGWWLLVMIAGSAPNLGIDWDRYYLPIVALGLVFAGVGAVALVDGVRQMFSTRRNPTASATTPPAMPTASSGSAG
jgi:hypothetical protein